jgi:hypothetical protein
VIDHRREQVAKANVRYRARRRQGRAAADSGAVRVMSSWMTESVIDHAGPVSDHANPVIDHKVLTEAISRTKRTSNSRRPCPLSADITSSEGSKPQERAGLMWHSLVVYQRLIEFV